MNFSDKNNAGAAGMEGAVYMEKQDIAQSVSLPASEYRLKSILCCKIWNDLIFCLRTEVPRSA